MSGNFTDECGHRRDFLSMSISKTRIASALLGLRQALKISIYEYDYLSKLNQINVDLFFNCYGAKLLLYLNCFYIYRCLALRPIQ